MGGFKAGFSLPHHASGGSPSDDSGDCHVVSGYSGCSGNGVDDAAVGEAGDVEHVPGDVEEGQVEVDSLGVGADVAGQAAAVEEGRGVVGGGVGVGRAWVAAGGRAIGAERARGDQGADGGGL